jgi:hypothetical protein
MLASVWTACDSLLIRRPIRTLSSDIQDREDQNIAINGHVMRAGNKDAAFPQTKQLVLHGPRLQVTLANMMLPSLLHFIEIANSFVSH